MNWDITLHKNIDDIATENDIERQNQDTERRFETEEQKDRMESTDNEGERIGLGEAEIVNAAKFGNPKKVLDNIMITSDVEVKKQRKRNNCAIRFS